MYESWFRFRRRPFVSAPRLDDYYPAESSEVARKTLIACIQRGAGPGLLVGRAGGGKTTLCHQLLTHFRSRTSVGLLSCSGLTTRRTLLQNVLFELGQPYRGLDEGEMRLSLIDHLTSRDVATAGTVVILDDAHHLAEELFEDVRMLSNLVRDGHWCVHLVMAGSVHLEETLALPRMESLNQRLAARCYIEPFRAHESEAYVRQQVQRSGGDPGEVFDDDALRQIHDSTSGIPRLVNQLCDHALVLAAAGGCRQLDAQGILEAWSDLQHLPPPQRETPATDLAESVVEFGVLDGEADPDQHNDRGELVELSSERNSPLQNREKIATSDTALGQCELQFEPDPLMPAGSPAIDVGTRLDAIERQLESVDQDDVTASGVDSTPVDNAGLATNPFLEQFADEELIVDHPCSMFNRVVRRQPAVVTEEGQQLTLILSKRAESPHSAGPMQAEICAGPAVVAPIREEDLQPSENAIVAEQQVPLSVAGDAHDLDADFDEPAPLETIEFHIETPFEPEPESCEFDVNLSMAKDEPRWNTPPVTTQSCAPLADTFAPSVVDQMALSECLMRNRATLGDECECSSDDVVTREARLEEVVAPTVAVAPPGDREPVHLEKTADQPKRRFQNLFTRLSRG